MAVDGHVFHVGVTTGTALLRAQLCCALYCLVARRPLTESPEPWRDAVAALLQEPLRVRDYRRAQ